MSGLSAAILIFQTWRGLLVVALAAACAIAPQLLVGAGEHTATADVVVIVDTSTSMKRPGMDPQRTSLLVTRLLADIVPGDLAVVRFLDISKDSNLIPSKNLGTKVPCSDPPPELCDAVTPTNDWYGNARAQRFGALVRTARGDAGFKQELDGHLDPIRNNSLCGLAFRSAQGVFDSHGTRDVPRTIVWLSDGDAADQKALRTVVQELTDTGVLIVPVVFGSGDLEKPRSLGLSPVQVRTPAEIIKAFADVFRHMVQAPYEQDNTVAAQPSFQIKPQVEEAWVVVYGDDSLSDVTIDTPEGARPANYAQDRRQGAGAYRVLHVERPTLGTWTVHVTGGGAAAYTVIQRSGLLPVLVAPQTATAGIAVPLVAGIGSDQGGGILAAGDLPRDISLEVEIDGQRIGLVDDGTSGDAVANDGRFTALVTFAKLGQIPVIMRARSSILDRSARAEVAVTGMFRAAGPVDVDLGNFSAPGESCRTVHVNGEHRGELPFVISGAGSLPGGHSFEIRQSRGVFHTGQTMQLGPGELLQICLLASSRAPSSVAHAEHWLDLRVAGSSAPNAVVPVNVSWNLTGLAWWQRWRWLILTLLTLLLFIIWIYGYIRPQRFPRGMAITFVPERAEVDEQTPQPVAQWSGVGIRWYRDARAYLHSSYRLNGNRLGAVAMLHAVDGGTQVRPGEGCTLYREAVDGDWEPVAAAGRRSGSGEVYRVGEQGPFFRVSVRKS